MFKKLNKKGFTLAELLIVVAIIGVLVAISIPIFTAQLKKARLATNQANARAGYAMVVQNVLSPNTEALKPAATGDTTYTYDVTTATLVKDGAGTADKTKVGDAGDADIYSTIGYTYTAGTDAIVIDVANPVKENISGT